MCGAALGMGCNGTYAFWGPLYCLVVCGFIFGGEGWNIAWPGWVGAITMVIGIFVCYFAAEGNREGGVGT